MKTQKHIIWSNYYLDFENDWKEELENEHPEMSEDELIQVMNETNNLYLDDERVNLNIQMDGEIIVIADLELWNGHKSGYKIISSGKIANCLISNTYYTTWYVDELGDFRCDAIHHDGTNHYLYRAFKAGITEEAAENLKSLIYNGTATRRDITRVTERLGHHIAKVYGWKVRGAA